MRNYLIILFYSLYSVCVFSLIQFFFKEAALTALLSSSLIITLILLPAILLKRINVFKPYSLVRGGTFSICTTLVIATQIKTNISISFVSLLFGFFTVLALSKQFLNEKLSLKILSLFAFSIFFFCWISKLQFIYLAVIAGALQALSIIVSKKFLSKNSFQETIAEIFLGFLMLSLLLLIIGQSTDIAFLKKNLVYIFIVSILNFLLQFLFFYLVKKMASSIFGLNMIMRIPIAIFIDYFFLERSAPWEYMLISIPIIILFAVQNLNTSIQITSGVK